MQKENDFYEKKNNRSVCAKEPPVFSAKQTALSAAVYKKRKPFRRRIY